MTTMVLRVIGAVLVFAGLAVVTNGSTAFAVGTERDAAHLAAARELVKELGFYWIADQISERVRTPLVAALVTSHPDKEKEVRRLVDEIFSELDPMKNEMREETARIVAGHFSIGEINDLLGAGHTEAHEKLQEKSLAIMQRIMQFGQAWGQKLAQSVMQRFQERAKSRGIDP